MTKIGIVTHYYRSNNYGGNLQAYALSTYLNKIPGIQAEQICFSFSEKNDAQILSKNITSTSKTLTKRFISVIFHPLSSTKKIIKHLVCVLSPQHINNKINELFNNKLSEKFKIRQTALLDFNQNEIMHSDNVYDENDIENCRDHYDCFITGSDQVWSGRSNGFMLGFVDEKQKISYAASISRESISDDLKSYLKDKLSSFNAISVRDENDKKIISELTEKEVIITADPVFLLEKSDWDKILPVKRKINSKYVFSYFLGDNKKQKSIVKQFARKKNLKIVTIPHFKDNKNSVVFSDLFFGDIKPYDVSPTDFIALIRDAEYVFTDSFHATAFSIIYRKQFFTFDRYCVAGSMNSRITYILKQFQITERFCFGSDKESLSYLKKLSPIDYGFYDKEIVLLRHASEEFLKNNIQ